MAAAELGAKFHDKGSTSASARDALDSLRCCNFRRGHHRRQLYCCGQCSRHKTKDLPDFAVAAGVPAKVIGDTRDRKDSDALISHSKQHDSFSRFGRELQPCSLLATFEYRGLYRLGLSERTGGEVGRFAAATNNDNGDGGGGGGGELTLVVPKVRALLAHCSIPKKLRDLHPKKEKQRKVPSGLISVY